MGSMRRGFSTVHTHHFTLLVYFIIMGLVTHGIELVVRSVRSHRPIQLSVYTWKKAAIGLTPLVRVSALSSGSARECIMAPRRKTHVAAVLCQQWILRRRRSRARRLERIRKESRARRVLIANLLSLYASVLFTSLVHLDNAVQPHQRRVRTVWQHERSAHWWTRVVIGTYNDAQWISDFRMTRGTFLWLFRQLKPFLEENGPTEVCRWRAPVSNVRKVAITVYYFATGAGQRMIGNLFGVSRSTVCLAVQFVTKAIVKNLVPLFISPPMGQRVQEVVDGFDNKYQFPQCIGAIDGTHVPVTPPSAYKEDFRNRKGWFSVNAQCVVDHELMFTDVYVGWPGSAHDARVFRNSPLYLAAEAGQPLMPNTPTRSIGGTDIPLVLLGDPAYPIQTWLQKPYRTGVNTTADQRQFNYRLSRTRMVVERAFGRLKGRWRILLKTMETDITRVPFIFLACTVLHNVCELWREDFIEQWLEDVSRAEEMNNMQQPPRPEYPDRPAALATPSDVRDTLREYFRQHQL